MTNALQRQHRSFTAPANSIAGLACSAQLSGRRTGRIKRGHMVSEHIVAGRLKRLAIATERKKHLPIYVVPERGRAPGGGRLADRGPAPIELEARRVELVRSPRVGE